MDLQEINPAQRLQMYIEERTWESVFTEPRIQSCSPDSALPLTINTCRTVFVCHPQINSEVHEIVLAEAAHFKVYLLVILQSSCAEVQPFPIPDHVCWHHTGQAVVAVQLMISILVTAALHQILLKLKWLLGLNGVKQAFPGHKQKFVLKPI